MHVLFLQMQWKASLHTCICVYTIIQQVCEYIISVCMYICMLQVDYTCNGWLDKNKDPLNDSVVEQLKKSTDPFVSLLWTDYTVESKEKSSKI